MPFYYQRNTKKNQKKNQKKRNIKLRKINKSKEKC